MIQLGNRLAHYTQAINYAQFKPKVLLEQQEKEQEKEQKEEDGDEEGEEEGELEKEQRRERARGRWEFCLLAVLHDVKKKRKMWLWESMVECRRNRKKYVDLYVKVVLILFFSLDFTSFLPLHSFLQRKQGATLDEEEQKEWERLIHLLDFDSQLLCRKMGLNYLQKDRAYREQLAKFVFYLFLFFYLFFFYFLFFCFIFHSLITYSFFNRKKSEEKEPTQQGWGSWASRFSFFSFFFPLSPFSKAFSNFVFVVGLLLQLRKEKKKNHLK